MFASGKRAFGFCDRCGFRYDYHELKSEVVNRRRTGRRVCPPCCDIDHEQLQISKLNLNEKIALRHPRVDTAQDESRSLWSWNPVGHASTKLSVQVGNVKVTV